MGKIFKLVAVTIAFMLNIALSNAQIHEKVSTEQLQEKMNVFSQTGIKDTILYSLIGYFSEEGANFSQITSNKVYFNEYGLYYRLDLADEQGALAASFTFYKPHIPFADTANTINEHLCICLKDGKPEKVKKQGTTFACSDGDQNATYNIDCRQFWSLKNLVTNYYNKGYSKKNNIKIVPLEILRLEEND